MFAILILLMAAYGFAASADESMAMPTALPTFQGQESKFQRNTIATEPLKLETTVDSTYTVGLGDYFEILTPKGFDVVQVSPEGNISVPSCGMVMVDKMKLSEAKDAIKKLLSSKFDERYIQVQLVRPKKMTVSVLGAVQAPGRATVEQQTRLSGVITLGGGFVGMADKKNIKVIRGNDTLTVNYNEYESEGKGEVNLMLEGGDVIFVPYIKSDATISVETVAANVTVPYVEGRTLGEYLDKTPGAMDLKAKWVKIKKPSGTVDVYELTKARDLRLEPQSHIELWNKDPYIYVGGAVAAVGKALYTPGLHAIDYIGASGVTIITGSFRRVSRIRNGKCESIDPYNGEIQPGDYIEIPRSIYESVKDVTLFLASLLSVVATAIIISTY
ncbi:MAG: polysaccharide biosynthesis/export family protein [Fibrobacter sp.]|jgi:protein involved in polysaccharide export with SLBB domain|nr:polysaccharide biosynthesis/export family protein [Fibrobacter sp.]